MSKTNKKKVDPRKQPLRSLHLSELLERRLLAAMRSIAEIVRENRSNLPEAYAAANKQALSTVQLLIREFLPADSYLVQSGKVIDVSGELSDKFDVIVSMPPTVDIGRFDDQGVALVPFETVYAIGDVRAAGSSTQMLSFCAKLKSMNERLSRKRTPADLMRQVGPFRLMNADKPPEHLYRNPLFSFLLGMTGRPFDVPDLQTGEGTFDGIAQLAKIYGALNFVPTFVGMLDEFVVIPVQIFSPGGEIESFGPLLSPFHVVEPDEERSEYQHKWVLCKPRERKFIANFATFMSLLSAHLQNCVLTEMDLGTYLNLNDAIRGFYLFGPVGGESDLDE